MGVGGGGGGVTRYVQLYTDKCIPWDERIACVTGFVFITPARRRLSRVYLHFWRMDAVLPGANYQSRR